MRCIICLESNDNNTNNFKKSLRKTCNCKYNIHSNCFDQMTTFQKNNCLICRTKFIQRSSFSTITNNNNDQFLYYTNCLIFYLMRNPNIFSFILSVIITLFVTTFYILPVLIWLSIYEKIYYD